MVPMGLKTHRPKKDSQLHFPSDFIPLATLGKSRYFYRRDRMDSLARQRSIIVREDRSGTWKCVKRRTGGFLCWKHLYAKLKYIAWMHGFRPTSARLFHSRPAMTASRVRDWRILATRDLLYHNLFADPRFFFKLLVYRQSFPIPFSLSQGRSYLFHLEIILRTLFLFVSYKGKHIF